jgi:hypothetical protein
VVSLKFNIVSLCELRLQEIVCKHKHAFLLAAAAAAAAAPAEDVTAAFLEQPGPSSSALEAAVRLTSTETGQQDVAAAARFTADIPWQVALSNAAVGLNAVQVSGVAKVVAAVTSPAAAAGLTAGQQQQQQQYSLLITLLKHAGLAGSQTSVNMTREAVAAALSIINLHRSWTSSSTGRSRGGASSSRSSSQLTSKPEALVTVARALLMLQAVLTSAVRSVAGDSSDDVDSSSSSSSSSVEKLLQQCGEATAWLATNLEAAAAAVAGAKAPSGAPAAAAAAARVQELAQQGQEVAAALTAYTSSSSSSTAAGSVLEAAAAVMTGDLGQQLQRFAAGVCALLPVRLCCNSPLCYNMGKVSELQLAGGKGTICSACKAASYCSRDCQLAHWKQHKKVCKQLSGKNK